METNTIIISILVLLLASCSSAQTQQSQNQSNSNAGERSMQLIREAQREADFIDLLSEKYFQLNGAWPSTLQDVLRCASRDDSLEIVNHPFSNDLITQFHISTRNTLNVIITPIDTTNCRFHFNLEIVDSTHEHKK
jgi:type II secretory pathway pseudopilin PulG